MPPILLGVGPVTIGVIGPQPGTGQNATADAALESLDDPVALLGDRVVGVDDLLATVFADVLGPACAAVTVVHPTWWPRRRVERVRAAAAVTAATVTAVPRSELLRRHRGGDPVVVEIATDRVAVCRRGPVRLLGRRDHAGIAALVAHRASGTPVLIDVPDSVPGAAHTAAEVRKALADSGIDARTVDIYRPPDAPMAASTARRRPWITAAALTVTVVTVTLAVAMWPRTTDAPGPEAVALVEGRVSVEIPPDWAVRRVTGGQSIAAAARTLGVVEQTLFNWVKADRQGRLKGAGSKVVSAEQMEISRLRAELARVKMERDILGKATAYFAKVQS